MTNTPAGWYPNPDPTRPGSVRYWDGIQWTEHVDSPVGSLAQVSPRRSTGKLVAKIVVPIVIFFVLGIGLIVYLGVAIVCGEASHYCSSSDNLRNADASAVASVVKAADPRVVSATVEQGVSGTGYGWIVDVVLSGDEPVTSDQDSPEKLELVGMKM